MFLKLIYSCGFLCIFTEEIVCYALENDTAIHETSQQGTTTGNFLTTREVENFIKLKDVWISQCDLKIAKAN